MARHDKIVQRVLELEAVLAMFDMIREDIGPESDRAWHKVFGKVHAIKAELEDDALPEPVTLTEAVWKTLMGLDELIAASPDKRRYDAALACKDTIEDVFAPCDGCGAVEVEGKVLLVDSGDTLCPSCYGTDEIRLSVVGRERGREAAS